MPMFEHAPSSQGLAPCDLVQELTGLLKGTHFQLLEGIHKETAALHS
jgi:hypothetical protein